MRADAQSVAQRLAQQATAQPSTRKKAERSSLVCVGR